MRLSSPLHTTGRCNKRSVSERAQTSSRDRPRIRVCFVVGVLGRGGAERQLVYWLRTLRDQAVETRVLSLSQGQPFQREIEDLGVPVEWVGANPSRVARLAAIVAALRRQPADVVQSTHFYTNLYAAVAAAITGARSIGAIRGDVLEALRANSPFGLAGLFLPNYLVVNSPPARQDAVDRGRSPTHVLLVRNVVDGSRFGFRAYRGAAAGPEGLRLLFIGRLTHEKRADRFLRLVERTSREFAGWNVEARIVGDGPERAVLEDLRSTLQLDPSKVQFMGEMQDMAPLYAWADLLVLTSDHEGSPNVILEAMSCGLPVIATAVGGVPDLLCFGGGLMARPQSEDALFAVVAKLATDAQLAELLAAAGTRYVARNHSVESLSPQLDTIYRMVVAGRTPRRASS
jgi:glycosyltransferase involved in cell wall biosynthesis